MSNAPTKQPYSTTGIIVWMFPGKGYCMVKGRQPGTEVDSVSFAHAYEFKDPNYTFEEAREGHTVSYRVTHDGEKGNKQRARDVRHVEKPD